MSKFDDSIKNALYYLLKSKRTQISFNDIWEKSHTKRVRFLKPKYILVSVFSLMLLVLSCKYIYINLKSPDKLNMNSYNESNSSQYASSVKCVVWNNTYYYATVINIPKEDLDDNLGEVTNMVKIASKNGESNAYPCGTKLYSIKNEDVSKAIAIKENDNYRKATIIDK